VRRIRRRGGAGSGAARSAGTARMAAGKVLGGGRYRLREQLGREGDSSTWGAVDEVLRRRVVVWIFPPGLERAGTVVAAAHAACHLDDPRLARVYDTNAQGEFPYVVTEWPTGWHLGELLKVGPGDPVRAAAVVAEAADALAVAHAAGLSHLCLRPCSLWWDPAGRVKVSGVGIAAAAAGIDRGDPALADARGLGNVLYAALTGYWPGVEQTPLPAAPSGGDGVYKPSRIRPCVPREFDAVACRALPQASRDAGPPILDPAQLAGELAQAAGVYSLRCGLPRLCLPGGAGKPSGSSVARQPLVVAPAAMTAPLMPESATVPMIPAVTTGAVRSSPVATGQGARLAARPVKPAGKARSAPRGRRRRHRLREAISAMLMLAFAVSLAIGGWYLARHGFGGSASAPHGLQTCRC
jgi:eukaryotic-like serine/threonine-protein kinase